MLCVWIQESKVGKTHFIPCFVTGYWKVTALFKRYIIRDNTETTFCHIQSASERMMRLWLQRCFAFCLRSCDWNHTGLIRVTCYVFLRHMSVRTPVWDQQWRLKQTAGDHSCGGGGTSVCSAVLLDVQQGRRNQDNSKCSWSVTCKRPAATGFFLQFSLHPHTHVTADCRYIPTQTHARAKRNVKCNCRPHLPHN